MSFAADVKSELCRLPVNARCCAVSESYGVLLYCNTFTNSAIKIVTDSRPFARRLPRLFRRAFGFDFDLLPEDPDKLGKLALAITDERKIEHIFDVCGFERERILAHHINYGVLEEECCRQSFVRGAFLAGGSVTDPQKRYHLELVTDHYSVSRETYALLLDMDFAPKSTDRSGRYITYFKSSGAIEDLLTTIGAPVSAMQVMEAKILKEMTNSVNRRVNCDTANVTKTVEAASEQVAAIRRLESTGTLEALPDKLRETALLRLEYPELSIGQLAAAMNPPVTKSCLSHRLRRLMALAGEKQEDCRRKEP